MGKYRLALHSLQLRGGDEVSVRLSETCEAVVLQVAARGVVEAVEQANELQRKYEASGCAALDALQAPYPCPYPCPCPYRTPIPTPTPTLPLDALQAREEE